MNKLIILSAALSLSVSSLGMAGVIIVDEEKARLKEQQEKQRNDRSNSNISDDSASRSSQSSTGKDEKGTKKKNANTNHIFGF